MNFFESFGENIDPDIKSYNGKSVGEVVVLDDNDLSAYLYIEGFDDANIPIVVYKQVKYKSEIDWEATRYGAGDQITDGDMLPYVFGSFFGLPSMGEMELHQVDELPPIGGWDSDKLPSDLYEGT